MKDIQTNQSEKFTIRRGILGWCLVPQDHGNCPLLIDLCDGEKGGNLMPLSDYPTLQDALLCIRDVAKDKGLAVLVCGKKQSPTVVLRRKKGDPHEREPAFPEQRIDLKWCVFGEHRETWQECGFGSTLEAIEHLKPCQWLKVLSSPGKECRSASVVVIRTGDRSWRVNGVITEMWDDVGELADTLGILLVEGLMPSDGDVPDDEDGKAIFLAGYNQRHGTAYKAVMEENSFRSAVSFSGSTGEPGVDLEFARKVQGSVDRLIKVLSDLEDKLLNLSEERWNDLKPECNDAA